VLVARWCYEDKQLGGGGRSPTAPFAPPLRGLLAALLYIYSMQLHVNGARVLHGFHVRYVIMAFSGARSLYPLTVRRGKHAQDVHKERERVHGLKRAQTCQSRPQCPLSRIL